MMDNTKTFEQYLLTKGVVLPKDLVTSEEILNNPEKLARVGNMCKEYKEEIRLLVEARIAPLKEEMLMRATPYELLEIRRSVMEIASIITDADSYVLNREAQIKVEEQQAIQKANEVGGEVEKDNSQPLETL